MNSNPFGSNSEEEKKKQNAFFQNNQQNSFPFNLQQGFTGKQQTNASSVNPMDVQTQGSVEDKRVSFANPLAQNTYQSPFTQSGGSGSSNPFQSQSSNIFGGSNTGNPFNQTSSPLSQTNLGGSSVTSNAFSGQGSLFSQNSAQTPFGQSSNSAFGSFGQTQPVKSSEIQGGTQSGLTSQFGGSNSFFDQKNSSSAFQPPTNLFGQSGSLGQGGTLGQSGTSLQTSTPFGQSGTSLQTSTSLGQSGTLFGQSSTPFGQSGTSITSLPSNELKTTTQSPFGQSTTVTTPAVQNTSSTLFSQQPEISKPPNDIFSSTQPSFLGSQNISAFGGQPSSFSQVATPPSLFPPTQPSTQSSVFPPTQPATQISTQTSTLTSTPTSNLQSTQPTNQSTQLTNQSTQPTLQSNLQSSQNLDSSFQSQKKEDFSQQSVVTKEIPLFFRQKTVSEVIEELLQTLEKNIKEFHKKAYEIYLYDEKIIKARNNYCKILDTLEREESRILELEENLDFFEKWISDLESNLNLKENTKDELISNIDEIEKLYEDFNKIVSELKDEDDEVMCLINENHNLVKMLDRKVEEFSEFEMSFE
ncbi:hypothetical protein CWI38_0224p0020 [Hamiltosporidium tvaerminnensis]|uniref:Nucleoporin NSP1-like C-terminal domain-containing protein n=1 Tax=Hamiltosporidium tvaerminnensis TaxID=1176355 RepID=A0A4Q9M1X0_9MICR|nr:hypothetical protein CWI38_0224p0020 [Hamiltosporidium tvaerminnensis]